MSRTDNAVTIFDIGSVDAVGDEMLVRELQKNNPADLKVVRIIGRVGDIVGVPDLDSTNTDLLFGGRE